jgi:hypothetical protein
MTWSSIEFLLVVLERGVYQRPMTVSVSGLADQAFQIHPGVEQKVSLESSHSCNVNQFVRPPKHFGRKLLTPTQVGPLNLSHRVVLAAIRI